VATTDLIAPARARRPIGVQVLRGIGWTGAGLFALGMAALLVETPGANEGIINDDLNGHTTIAIHPQWKAIAVVFGVVVVCTLAFRRLRRWQARPRWLMPLAVVILIGSTITALKPFGMSSESDSQSCIPVVDAWHQVVPNPGPVDMRVWRSQFAVQLHRSPYTDPARSRQFYDQQRATIRAQESAIKATPAFQRGERYMDWTFTQGVCAPRSRQYLGVSALVLIGGSAALAAVTVVPLRRRRKTA
jgi:hypothetical protein